MTFNAEDTKLYAEALNRIKELEKENKLLREKLELTISGLEFYADKSSWSDAAIGNYAPEICESDEEWFGYSCFGGKKAREILKQLNKKETNE